MSREIEIVANHHWDLLTDTYGGLVEIGSGDQGVVYEMVDRPGHVLKMACTSGDAFIASYTLRWPARFCAQVPEFKEVATLKGYFLTVREDLPDAKMAKSAPDLVEWLVEQTYGGFQHATGHHLRDSLKADIASYLADRDLTDARFTRTILRDVVELLVWARENGIYISDAHEANWGMRDGVYVLRDWGCCSPDRGWGLKAADDAFDAIYDEAPKLDP